MAFFFHPEMFHVNSPEDDRLHSEIDRERRTLNAHFSKFDDPHNRIGYYTGGSAIINNRLIKLYHEPHTLETSDIERVVDHREALNKTLTSFSPLKQDHWVFSGVGHKLITKLNSMDEGSHFHSPTFISTSTRPGGGAQWAKMDDQGMSHVVTFKIPKGTNHLGAFIASRSDHPNEDEFLLKAGSNWLHVGSHIVDRNSYYKHGKPNLKLHVFEPR